MELSNATSLQLFVSVPGEDIMLDGPEQVGWLKADLTTDLPESV